MVDRPLARQGLPFRIRFARNQRGATAVEFALIALPFLGLMAGIIELGLLFMGSVALDNALHTTSRMIRTGEIASTSITTPTQFRDEVCAKMALMFDCKSKLSVDVKTITSFDSITLTSPIQGGTFNPGNVQFQPGTSGSLVMVTAYYRWTMFMPTMNQALQRLPGETLLTSVITFRNEPFA
jgi:Flp pilus assembly protein TadG